MIVSLTMLLLVLSFVDFDRLQTTIKAIPLSLIVSVTILYSLGQTLSAYKWWLITSSSIEGPFLTALRAYWVGMYFNVFGFGTVGGDVARGIIFAGRRKIKTEALASVIADRAHGLATLALMGIAAVYLVDQDKIDFSYKLLLLTCSLVIIFGWFLGPSLLLKFTPLTSRWRNKIERTAAQFPRAPRRLIHITIISCAFHGIQIFTNGYLAHELGVDVPWMRIYAAIPFVNILGTLPISWQGLGVRETSLLFFLRGYINGAQAIALGAVWFIAVTITSAIGGIVAAISGDLDVVTAAKEKDISVIANGSTTAK